MLSHGEAPMLLQPEKRGTPACRQKGPQGKQEKADITLNPDLKPWWGVRREPKEGILPAAVWRPYPAVPHAWSQHEGSFLPKLYSTGSDKTDQHLQVTCFKPCL
jgi:hypothetical protein